MRWPLRYQILFPFAGVMLVVILGVSLLDAYLAAQRTQRQIERQLHEVASTLLDATFPLTDAVLKQTRGLSGAEFVLTDLEGHLAASSLSEVDPALLPTAGQALGTIEGGASIALAGSPYFHSVIEVRPRGGLEVPMRLHILYPERSLREARWQAAYPPLLVGGASLGVVVALATVIAGRLSRPILELRRQLSNLVRGDFQPIPLPQRNDELRDLVGSVNLLSVQLQESNRMIKQAERLALLGQLSAGLAHQLRNSVTGARLALQLHGRHCRQIDQDSLAVALRQLTMTESHLQRFLTAGQPATSHRSPCALAKLVADVVGLVAPTCDHRNVALRCPPAADRVESVSADADQLRQLLMNLVLNGIEAAGAGGWVQIELAAKHDRVLIRVSDSGPGLDSQMRERLFEPFATGKPEGIGLGLVVAKKIADSHGGSIRYTNQMPTCFEVELPVSAPEVPAGQRRPLAESSAPGVEEPTFPVAGSLP